MEHTLFQCLRRERKRSALGSTLEPPLTPENIIRKLVSSNENWRTGSKMIDRLMAVKEMEKWAYKTMQNLN